MDVNCDPESEALIWKLHRELNGLTRSARRANTEFVSLDDTRREARQPANRSRAKPASTSQQTEPGAPPKRRKPCNLDDNEHNTVSKTAKTATTDDPGCRVPTAVLDQVPPGGMKSGYLAHGTSHQPQQDSLTRDFPTSANPAPIPPLATHVSPLVAAAVAAGQLVRERAKCSKTGEAGQRQIKCFYAGVRWGISLKPSDIQSRAELATALNDSLAGEILSCGRGDNLHILFLDNAGSLCEFPSLRSAGSSAKENVQKWQAAVSTAVKVYVRRV